MDPVAKVHRPSFNGVTVHGVAGLTNGPRKWTNSLFAFVGKCLGYSIE